MRSITLLLTVRN